MELRNIWRIGPLAALLSFAAAFGHVPPPAPAPAPADGVSAQPNGGFTPRAAGQSFPGRLAALKTAVNRSAPRSDPSTHFIPGASALPKPPQFSERVFPRGGEAVPPRRVYAHTGRSPPAS